MPIYTFSDQKISTLIFHFWNCFIKFQSSRSGGWYDVLQYHKIPAELSKDGQEHLANNKKEFFQYFKKELNQSKDTTEFSLLRRLYEVQNYVVSRDFGQSFGNLTIPDEYTKDGKVHVVQNDEGILQIYGFRENS